MADKQITELPANSGVTNETLFPAYQPGAVSPAQKVTGAQVRAFAEDAAKKTAGSIARGGTFTPQFNDATGYLSWTNDAGLPNPDPVQLEGVSSVNGKTGAVTVFNPNLLDNWCFADPVDQRQGYVIPPGTQMYSDPELTTPSIVTGGYNPIQLSGSGWICYSVGEVRRYTADTNKVRGYVNAGYTIDRWQLSGTAVVVLNSDGTITVSAPSAAVAFVQYFGKPKNGQIFTLSALVSAYSGSVSLRMQNTNTWASVDKVISTTGIAASASALSGYGYRVGLVLGQGASVTLSAMKFESGSTQTLAHQNTSGNWILTDSPPDKGKELLKCIQSTADSSDALANKVVYHTGNKPSGSYTGNGDATARTIATGGIGRIIVIRSGKGCVIVFGGDGSFGMSENGTFSRLPSTQASFDSNGVLTIASDNILLNESGRTYTYQVL